MTSFLFLHGLDGSDDGHWQRWLAARLTAAGERVLFPELPDASDPEPAAWEAALREELDSLSEPPVVLCHSLGCLLWLRHVSASPGSRAERVLLVAPPHREDIRPVREFTLFTPDPVAVGAAAEQTRIVCSDDDPYCPDGAPDVYASRWRFRTTSCPAEVT